MARVDLSRGGRQTKSEGIVDFGYSIKGLLAFRLRSHIVSLGYRRFFSLRQSHKAWSASC